MRLSPAAIIARLPALPAGAHYVLAYSGGLDSTVLLHLLAGRVPVRAVHVHHGLQAQADGWAQHCATQCTALNVPCTILRVEIPANNLRAQGMEAAARDARYAALAAELQAGDVLLTAQHANDQAETVLLQLLRGAGPKGLAAMPERREFAGTLLLRPLLPVLRRQIRDWADAHGLSWVEDPSNLDPALERSWLRQSLWPLLQARNAHPARLLTRVASLQAEALELQEALAQMDLPACQRNAHSLSCTSLLALTPARRVNVLRYWLQNHGVQMPPASLLQVQLPDLLNAREDAQPHISWGKWALQRHRDGLYLLAMANTADTAFACHWQPPACIQLPGGTLTATPMLGSGLCAQPQPFALRQRSGGERLLLHGIHRQVKDLLREADIPPWLRRSLPLLYCGDELVAIASLQVADNWRVQAAAAPGWQLHWQPLQPGWPE